jgi:Ca2+-transporting ATPase
MVTEVSPQLTPVDPGPAGLSAADVRERLAADGPNELPRQGQRSAAVIVGEVLREPMLALLLAASLVYLALGDMHEALILAAFAGISIVITVVQESRSERALEALLDLASPRALVIRDGLRQRIAGRDVVRGDRLILGEGDRVPADLLLLESNGLQIDESLLTGESVSVAKRAGDPHRASAIAQPGGDDLPFAYSGTLVVQGDGLGLVLATGRSSKIGQIGAMLGALESEVPHLRQQTRKLVLWFAAAGATVSLVAFLLYGLWRGSWLEATLAAIAIGMSMLPEEFPVVLTVFMAMGAMRMSRQRVLTRRASAIETLGAATVLCTDKTGTLTQNRMQIAQLWLPNGTIRQVDASAASLIEDDFRLLVELGVLASAPQAVDPMELAFHDLHRGGGGSSQTVAVDGWSIERHYPLAPELLARSHVWSSGLQGAERVVATKGAPEAIADLCNLPEGERERVREAVDALAGMGLRVLGVAEARWGCGELPHSPRGFDFVFRGLVGLADPLRPSVPEAVRQCREAGIRVVMITGDYPATARAIARQAGIDGDVVLTGEALSAMDDPALAHEVGRVNVFARIMPEQKLRLVEALKAAGEMVAMTGDGVNDAPSLKAAHIGIAMGGRGTDVAREAASLVLLDDDFGSIVAAVRMGRRIYDNLRKAMGFIVAVHIPIAGLALLPLLTGMPLLLGPVHIAFLELIIDPVCSVAFEAEEEERNAMQRPPRAPQSALFSSGLVGWALIQGSLMLAVTCGLTLWLWQAGLPADQLRAGAFLVLVLGIVGLIVVNRRFERAAANRPSSPNWVLLAILATVAAILIATQLMPIVANLFGFGRLAVPLMLTIVLVSLTASGMLQVIKPLWRKRLLG